MWILICPRRNSNLNFYYRLNRAEIPAGIWSSRESSLSFYLDFNIYCEIDIIEMCSTYISMEVFCQI